ncbi:MAG: Magnesium and cobalt efflux protein CorC [Chlamydiae bacterium]|nr:Magnesium and cobalt efflux protein CorC [Chlamydiota bacterium]
MLFGILLICLLFISAFFSATEISMFSLSRHEIDLFSRSSKKRQNLVAKVISRPGDLLVVLLIMNIFANILLQNVIAETFPPQSSWIYTILLPIVLMLFIGEVIPKAIALNINKKIAQLTAPIISKIVFFMRPIAKRAVHITNFISNFIFFFLKEQKEITEQELVHAMEHSKEKGVLEKEETELLLGFLDLQKRQVKQIMNPKEDILFYDIGDPLDELIDLFSKENCSRVPVCKNTLDQILGIIDLESYFLNEDKLKNPVDLQAFLKPAYFVPETMLVKHLIEDQMMKENEIAIIVDEYGLCTGLVTDEDLSEVLVGDILDKRDENKRLFTMPSKDVMIASAKLEIEEFEEAFGTEIEKDPSAVTIGGWLLERIGKLPKNGEEFRFSNLLFHVLQATPSRILKLYIRKLKKK